MDLSKLPKLSKTGEAVGPQPQAPEALPPAGERAAPFAAMAPPGAGTSIGLAEAWISLAIGTLLLFIFPNTLHFIFSHAEFLKNNSFTDEQGNSIGYTQSVFYWMDLGVTVFASALILEGIALAVARRRAPIWVAFVVTVSAALFNVGVIIYAQPHAGFPLVCGLGVAVLGYMAMTQWRLIKMLP